MFRVDWKVLGLALAAAGALTAQPFGGRGGLGFGFGGGFGDGFGLAGRTVTGAPFSAQATTVSQHVLANGNQIQRQEQANLYRDSQGRVRIETTIPATAGHAAETSITLYDPVAGFVYRLNPQKMTGVQSPLRQRTPPPANSASRTRGTPGNTEALSQNLGTQTINGVTAAGTQITRTIPAGTIGNTQAIQIVRATWVSSALQIPVQATLSDPRTGTTTLNLTNIVQSEPSSSLFVVPSGYTINAAPGPRGRFRR